MQVRYARNGFKSKQVAGKDKIMRVPIAVLGLSGCAGFLAVPVTTPVWLILAFLFVNRPVLRLVWHILTFLLSLTLFAGFASSAHSRNPKVKFIHRLSVVNLILVGLTWLLLALPLTDIFKTAGQVLAVVTF